MPPWARCNGRGWEAAYHPLEPKCLANQLAVVALELLDQHADGRTPPAAMGASIQLPPAPDRTPGDNGAAPRELVREALDTLSLEFQSLSLEPKVMQDARAQRISALGSGGDGTSHSVELHGDVATLGQERASVRPGRAERIEK